MPSKGVSLSIADAKVDTFRKLTKLSWNFFVRNFKQKSQKADFQRMSQQKLFNDYLQFGMYMLQNMFFAYFDGISFAINTPDG